MFRSGLVLISALTLTVTACSSGSDDTSSSDAGVTIEDTTGDTDSVPTSEVAEVPDTEVPDTEGPDSEFCEMNRALLSGELAEPTNFDESADMFDDLATGAPDALRADLDALVETFRELGDIDADSIDDPESLERLQEVFSRPVVIEASAAYDAYLTEVCNLSLAPEVAPVEPG